MEKTVDIAIIGAGTAGLNAMAQVKRSGHSFVLINGGALGTTCARVGCMPSKAFIQIAEDFHRRHIFDRHAIQGNEHLSIDHSDALEHVRDIRDILVDRVLGNSTDEMGDELISDTFAEFVEPGLLQAGEHSVRYNKAIIATGSRPIVPAAWKAFGNKILTTDDFFELETLPKRIAVIGMGVIGLELGQALHAMDVQVTGFDAAETVAKISDPKVAQSAQTILGKEFPIHLGHPADIQEGDNGLIVSADGKSCEVDAVLVAIGRRPNLDHLGLENLGTSLDEHGLPAYDPATMQIKGQAVFLAGDVNGDLPILHEASDEGKIAGFNASQESSTPFQRKTPLSIAFCDPNIAHAGANWEELKGNADIVTGEMPLGPVGRALIMAKNKGIIRLYANKYSGQLLGASLIAPKGENLAHLLAWAIQQKLTVVELLRMPFYHPTIEEAFQAALYNLYRQLELDKEEKLLELKELRSQA